MTLHEIEHRPLREREGGPLSSDVADALEMLVGTEISLPRAFTRPQVVEQLIKIVHMEDDGTIGTIHAQNRRALTDFFGNRLANSSVFVAGYKRYEARTKNPTVPVTDFFFRNVYVDGTVHDVLDAMADFEIGESLPKRLGHMRKNDSSQEFERDDDGNPLGNGPIAGIIILPPGSNYSLLRTWLQRRSNVAIGHLNSAVEALGRARPGTPALEKLRETVAPVRPGLTRALPAPKRK